ncbi:MAG TPA: GNAT family N-acetyltransferase [Leptolyngbyaceae cyanobacterium M33_DOE_097]|uniref:GNAT family N-acetyltransferase n=1 Tax=Oscillatoriales cyanobacterium SpSt-418 TaxID=2282169 RepID=A0A7C3PEY2_9CYAN|nr:GNAT family N-acetyltransferase [Leptolyngbyaceae cyanobacterium M33_DOE_097]
MTVEWAIAELSDLAEVNALARQVLEAFIFPDISPADQVTFSTNFSQSLLEHGLTSTTVIFGMRSPQGDLVAYILIRNKAHIAHLFVAPDWQRQGLGQRLLTFGECQAEQAGVSRLTVNAAVNAIPFYQKHGFTCFGAEQSTDGVRFQPMEKAIATDGCPSVSDLPLHKRN